MMRKLVMMAGIVLASFTSQAQKVDKRIYGHWVSESGEYLKMDYTNTFERYGADKKIKAQGEFELRGNYIYVTKIDDKYRLHFAVRERILVVTQPYSDKAWIFNRIQY